MARMIRRMLYRLRGVFHPISIFVIAQIAWGLLMFVWIRWYVIRRDELDSVLQRLPLRESFGGGQWVILVQGCLLMGVLLLGVILIFVSFRRQQRLARMQDSILSSVTHELKTPLATIRMNAETLLLRDLSKEQRFEFLSRTLRETDRLQKLVDGVLISARLESIQSSKSKQRDIDILAVVQDSYTRMRDLFGENRTFWLQSTGIEEGGEIFVRCNPHEIAILVDNLLDNAVKYTKAGGIITVEMEASPQVFSLRVRDDGAGIEPSDLKRIFDRFFRVERTAKRWVGGSGLGLFVCKSVVKSHRGSIKATSEGIGKGATFHVELPRAHPTH